MKIQKFPLNLESLKKFFFTRRFVHFGLFMLCFIFAAKGLLSNLAEYQDNSHYIISPTFSSPSLVDLPTFAICLTNYIDEIKVRKFYHNDFDLVKMRRMKIDEKMDIFASKLSIAQIENVSLYFEQIFVFCELLLPNGARVSCNYENYTKIWLSQETKCYQFFHNLTYKYSPSKIKGQFWVNMKISKDRRDGSNLGILLNAQNTTIEPFMSNPNYFPVPTSVLYTIMLTYTKEVTQKLEAPYNTMCKNYSQPHIDQLNCSNSCVIRRLSRDNNSFWPSNLPTEDLDSNLYFKKIEEFHLTFRECLTQECIEQDCRSSRFRIHTKYEKFDYKVSSPFTIRLIYNFAPEKLIRYTPRVSREFSSALSFITAPLSFYLGIAFYNMFNFVVTCLEIPYQLFKKFAKSKFSRKQNVA